MQCWHKKDDLRKLSRISAAKTALDNSPLFCDTPALSPMPGRCCSISAFVFVWRHINKGEEHDRKNKTSSVGDCSVIDSIDKCATDRLQDYFDFCSDQFRDQDRDQNDQEGGEYIGCGREDCGRGAREYAIQGRQSDHGQKMMDKKVWPPGAGTNRPCRPRRPCSSPMPTTATMPTMLCMVPDGALPRRCPEWPGEDQNRVNRICLLQIVKCKLQIAD